MKRSVVLAAFLIWFSSIAYAQQLDPVTSWATIAANEFHVHSNIVYGKANNVDLKLDVITQGETTEPRPTLIFIHGGGWSNPTLTKDSEELQMLPYLARGMNTVNVDYRLTPVSLAPAAVEDCRCALRWVYDHAQEDGFDVSKLVVDGDSAGGHLSLMTGMLTPGAEFDNECPGKLVAGAEQPMKVAAIVNYYGVADVADVLQGPDTKVYALEWFDSLPNSLDLAKRLSPLTYVRGDLPPIITVHGDKDEAVPYHQAVELHQALDAAGVPNQLVTIPGGSHGASHWPREQILRAQKAVFSFLETHGILSPENGEQSNSISEWTAIMAAKFRRLRPNIVYGRANNVDLRLDVITADDSGQPRPTVIFIHGGGWVGGTKEGTELKVLPYLARGMNAVNVEYRLASVSLAPAAVEDCRCALRWVYDHAQEYGFDTNKLVVAGGSAGGHLSLMTGMLTASAGFDNDCPGKLNGGELEPMKVAAIVDYYGITDVTDVLQGPNTRTWALEWLGSLPNRMELARRLSPLTYVRKDLPPIIILHGDSDPTVPYPEGVRLHQALDEAGVANELITIPGGGHGGWPLNQDMRAQEAIFHFLEAHGILSP